MSDIKTYDFDGVVSLDEHGLGIRPGSKNDVIITGRSVDEQESTYRFLKEHNIDNMVFHNPLPFDDKTREDGGWHKVKVIKFLQECGFNILIHYDDDPIQAKIVSENTTVKVIHVNHKDLIELENIRR